MMILKEHNISVRLPQERAIDTGITFVQNDKGVYKLNVRVFDGDTEINYSQVSSATITFLKADGTVVQGDMQKATNMLMYYLGTNEIAAPGKLIATIQLLGANERLTTARFVFNVEKDLITEDAVKSTSEFAILQRLKEELEAIDVVDLTNQFNAHKAENVTQGDNPHGLIYEEGTWTPVLSFGGNSDGITYNYQEGRYRRINNIVFCAMNVQLTNKGTSTGQAVISGLPYSAGSIVRVINIAEFASMTLPQGGIDVVAELLSTQFRLFSNRSGATLATITDANFTNTSRIRIYFTYFIN